MLDRFIKNRYSPNDAVSALVKHWKVVQVNAAAVRQMQFAYNFYHKYVRLSKLTIAAGANFSQGGVPHIGAYFDPAKLREYQKEVKARVSLARVMPDIVTRIARNVRAR